MQTARRFLLVLVTAPDLKSAGTLARSALKARLAACVNLLPKVQSHYWWRGKLESSAEVLLVFKTTRARWRRLEHCLLARHPYETPEIIAVPLAAGNRRYLAWLSGNLRSPPRAAAARR